MVRRMLLVLMVALIMAAVVVASALPALAAPPELLCGQDEPGAIFFDPDEPQGGPGYVGTGRPCPPV